MHVAGLGTDLGLGVVEISHVGPSKRDRILGIACACYIGISGGVFMVPFKYGNKDVKGAEYLVSFGIGVAIVTLSMDALYFGTLHFLLGRLVSREIEGCFGI